MEFSPPVAYGILSPCNLWNSLPLEIKSSPSHPNFKNRLKSYYHVAKHGTPHLFRVILIYNSFVVCFAHSPWNINKNRIVLAFAVISKLRFAFSFTVNFHDAARAILSNRVCNIVTDNKSPELFFLIVWVTLSCWVYSHLACLMMSHHISRLLCFGPLVIFLSIVIDFDIRATLCIVYRWSFNKRFLLSVFLLYFFLPMCRYYTYMMCLMRRPPFQMLYLILLMSFWNVVLDSSDPVCSFFHFRFVRFCIYSVFF